MDTKDSNRKIIADKTVYELKHILYHKTLYDNDFVEAARIELQNRETIFKKFTYQSFISRTWLLSLLSLLATPLIYELLAASSENSSSDGNSWILFFSMIVSISIILSIIIRNRFYILSIYADEEKMKFKYLDFFRVKTIEAKSSEFEIILRFSIGRVPHPILIVRKNDKLVFRIHSLVISGLSDEKLERISNDLMGYTKMGFLNFPIDK